MTNDQTRADFEAEYRRYWGERWPDLTCVDGKYENNGRADLAWRFWQAATAKATLAERERCTLVCEKVDSEQMAKAKQKGQNHYEDYAIGAELCAAAIRLPLPLSGTAQPQVG